MKFKENECYSGFVLQERVPIKELNVEGYYFIHPYSGAKLIYLDTADTNRVFSVTFQTLPIDQTGVAHVVEHAVCCASEKYPLKDTFMEIDKGSINTALNACTYKDMTMYYAASQNEKDLTHLMEVYLDLVFHPLLHHDQQIFRQEGWHYEIEDETGALVYNGIVYNEMKGIFSEAGTRLEQVVHEKLFEGTCYAYDSGGVPEKIPTLRWEDAVAFHQHYYTPDNATFFLYGVEQIAEKMAYIHEYYLKDCPKKDGLGRESLIEHMQRIQRLGDLEDVGESQQISDSRGVGKSQHEQVEAYYPLLENEEGQVARSRNYLNLTFRVGEAVDGKSRLAFQILEHMLLKSAASPLQQVFIEQEKLGTALATGGYDPGKYQSTFAVTLTGCEEGAERQFKAIFFATLKQLVEQGLDKELIDAAIDTITFSLYEGESEGEPLGVLYSEDVQLSLYYRNNPFEYLKYKQYLQEIKKEKDKGYFEQLLQTYFLTNKQFVEVILRPSQALCTLEEERERLALEKAQVALTLQAQKALIELNEALEVWQMIENSEEALTCLPKLTRADLTEARKPLVFEEKDCEGVQMIAVAEETHHISYYHLLFDAEAIDAVDWPYLGLLSTLLTYVSTEETHYTVLENKINSLTGGLNCAVNAYAKTGDTQDYRPMFKISAKMLDEKSEAVIALLNEILIKSRFDEKDKIEEILQATLYEIERSFTGAPEYRATKYLYTGFSRAAQFEDAVSGMQYFAFIKGICEEGLKDFESLRQNLERVYQQLITKENLMISIMARETQIEKLYTQSRSLCRQLVTQQPRELSKGLSQEVAEELFKILPVEELKQEYKSEEVCFKVDKEVKELGNQKVLKEALVTTSDVQAVAWGANVQTAKQKFSGAWYVVAQFLESNYLWDAIRLQGGAYGCDLTLSRDGNVTICSYCDPEIEKTLQVYRKIGHYLEQLQLDEATIERYIIKTIGLMEYPLTMEQKSERATIHYLCGVSQELLDKERKEILQTSMADFKAVAKVFKALVKKENYCVIGGRSKIKETQGLYSIIRNLETIEAL